jgi:hypothetical protein
MGDGRGRLVSCFVPPFFFLLLFFFFFFYLAFLAVAADD